jgi:dTDP-4-amino-4,6-dideoxygalactose transaminase
MSNIIAGVVRGQIPHLDEHIAQKKAIYMRYKEGFKDLPVSMNPWAEDVSQPNFWLSCIIIDENAMCNMVRSDNQTLYNSEKHKSCPTEILEALSCFGAEGRPIWKPMHLQPIYRSNSFITTNGQGRGQSNAYIASKKVDVGADIFHRGLCLPSDNKMTKEEQDVVIEVVKRCFQ